MYTYTHSLSHSHTHTHTQDVRVHCSVLTHFYNCFSCDLPVVVEPTGRLKRFLSHVACVHVHSTLILASTCTLTNLSSLNYEMIIINFYYFFPNSLPVVTLDLEEVLMISHEEAEPTDRILTLTIT